MLRYFHPNLLLVHSFRGCCLREGWDSVNTRYQRGIYIVINSGEKCTAWQPPPTAWRATLSSTGYQTRDTALI